MRVSRWAVTLVLLVLVLAMLRWAQPADAAGRPTASVTTEPQPQAIAARPVRSLTLYELAAARYRLSPAMLRALHQVESSSSSGGCLANLQGSGAIGPFQFMPSTFRAYGVDGDGDGRLDICGLTDSMFSAAHYLHVLGADGDAASAATRRALKLYGTDPARVIGLATSTSSAAR